MRALAFLATLIAISTLPAFADEVTDKQKAVAAKNVKILGLDKHTTVESASFLVCSSLPEAKAKALADQLEKVAVTAKKALQYEPTEEPWKGKLTVYVFDDNRPFKIFMLTVAKERTSEPYHIAIRSDEPYIAKAVAVGQKQTEPELIADTQKLVAAALMASKAGSATPLPDWIRFGFGRAAVARAAGTGSKPMNDMKSKARAAIIARPPAKAEDAWATENTIVDTSLMDYIAFGPGAANFSKILVALRPAENGDQPGIDQVLMAVMWTKDSLDMAWKKYVLTGK